MTIGNGFDTEDFYIISKDKVRKQQSLQVWLIEVEIEQHLVVHLRRARSGQKGWRKYLPIGSYLLDMSKATKPYYYMFSNKIKLCIIKKQVL